MEKEKLQDLFIETLKKQIELDSIIIESLKNDYDRLLTLYEKLFYETQKETN